MLQVLRAFQASLILLPQALAAMVSVVVGGRLVDRIGVRAVVIPGLTVVQVTDLNSVNVTAYVDEGAINNVKVGQDVDIHIDAYSDTSFTGKVQRIVMATAGQFSLLPTEDNVSGNFTKVGQRIPVVISLDGTSGKAVMPGLSVSVTIHIH